MALFTTFTGSDNTVLTNALLAPGSGITVSAIVLKASGQEAVNLYDGSLAPLGIGAGLLLTSGTTPGTSNTVGWFGTDNSTTVFDNGDADINAVVNTVFQTQSYDATTLEFDFNAGATATSVSFDLVFGSDEYPEWVDQFVDCAVVMVNGVNYAYFNHDPLAPLSVVSSNLAAGYFQDNTGNVLPIEYDGVSHVLKIVAPIIAGQTNHIKIGIADTGDHIYDSGIFISNLSAGNIPGSGVVSSTSGTAGSDTLTGSTQAEYFDLQSGNDTVYAGGGDDIVVAGSGNDAVYGGSGADKMEGDAGDDFLDGGADVDTAVFTGNFNQYVVGSAGANTTLTSTAEGTDTLANVELVQFKDGLYELIGGVLSPVGAPASVANSAGVAVISGVAMAGKTLTAIVTDADGITSPASISYQWQTSADGGSSWTNSSVTAKTYLLSSADVGKQVQVIATYADTLGASEMPTSAPVTVAKATSGFSIDPMVISAPAGASVMDPLTTLIKNAVDFGYTPNEASMAVKSVFGLASNVTIATYDAYAVLLTTPADPTAVAFMKVAAQVAMTASVSDPTGMNMMLAVMNAAATGKTLNLASATDLATVGVDPTVDPATGKSPLSVIQNLNKNLAGDAHDLGGIKLVWNDWAGKTDAVQSVFLNHLEKISIHINQAPTGSATGSLAKGLESTDYVVNASDLLTGFSDPEGGALAVMALGADNGSVFDNGNGTFTITPPLNFNGPVELTYTVVDPLGASVSASQMFIIEPAVATPTNNAPTGTPSAVLAAGSEDVAYIVSAAALLVGFSDADGDTLSVSLLSADNGTVINNSDGTFTVTPTLNHNGPVVLKYDVTDGIDSVAATQSYSLAAVNDAPTTSAVTLAAIAEDSGVRVITQAQLLTNAADVDNTLAQLSATGLTIATGLGALVNNNNGTWNYTPALNDSSAVSFSYTVTDGALTAAGSATLDITPVNDAPTTSAVTLAAIAQDSGARLITRAQLLANASDVDNTLAQLSATGLTVASGLGALANNNNGTWSYTPALNDSSAVSFSYSVTDGNLSAAGSATLDITPLAGVTLTGTAKADILSGTAQDDTLNGLGSNDTLNGLAGNDTLNGGAGADKMVGGTGNDTYFVDSTGDVVTEALNEGTDTVHSTLSAYTLAVNVENLILDGSAAINGTGNTLANTLIGNSGNNVLVGGAGNDSLTGGSGADVFRFETALSAATNVDTIQDFIHGADAIQLENAIFTKLTKTGTLPTANFAASATAAPVDANDYILYNTTTGALYYDADGSGVGAAVQFAMLIGHPAVTAADFVVT